MWFRQVEALQNITADATKYFYTVAASDQKSFIDFLENPLKKIGMVILRNDCLVLLIFPQQERAARLLRFPELEDRKPTAWIDDMLALLRNHQPLFFLCTTACPIVPF